MCIWVYKYIFKTYLTNLENVIAKSNFIIIQRLSCLCLCLKKDSNFIKAEFMEKVNLIKKKCKSLTYCVCCTINKDVNMLKVATSWVIANSIVKPLFFSTSRNKLILWRFSALNNQDILKIITILRLILRFLLFCCCCPSWKKHWWIVNKQDATWIVSKDVNLGSISTKHSIFYMLPAGFALQMISKNYDCCVCYMLLLARGTTTNKVCIFISSIEN